MDNGNGADGYTQECRDDAHRSLPFWYKKPFDTTANKRESISTF